MFPLLEDRELRLFDGSIFVDCAKYDKLVEILGEEEVKRRKTFRIHPNFRVIGIASPPSLINPWLTQQMMSAFHFFDLSSFDFSTWSSSAFPSSASFNTQEIVFNQVEKILRRKFPSIQTSLSNKLANFYVSVQKLEKENVGISKETISIKTVLRVAKYVQKYGNLFSTLKRMIMLHYMPPLARELVEKEMRNASILPSLEEEEGYEEGEGEGGRRRRVEGKQIKVEKERGKVSVGTTFATKNIPKEPSLVPQISFYPIPKHTCILERMMRDFLLGEDLLLIGNQGVGKNKITDYFLQLLGYEREYQQLHRDSTVSSLSLSPSLEKGVILFQDSPLVKAMTFGRVLVIDEADKAPTEVVFIMKGLVSDGEITLNDGRKFLTPKSTLFNSPNQLPPNYHRTHKNFRSIFLANRPGFPFLGNDFFSEMGDCFSVHVVDNPSQEEEMLLLSEIAPNVPTNTLERITSVFQELRGLVEEGVLQYPYSLRELCSIAKHLEKFPKEEITTVLENVFSFDSFEENIQKVLLQVFLKHGLALSKLQLEQVSTTSLLSPPSPIPPHLFSHSFDLQMPRPSLSLFSSPFLSPPSLLPPFFPPPHLLPLPSSSSHSLLPLSLPPFHSLLFNEEKTVFFPQKNCLFGFPSSILSHPSLNRIYILTISPFELVELDFSSSIPNTTNSTSNSTTFSSPSLSLFLFVVEGVEWK